MKVILLCAGYATRLKPLTDNTPKPLLPIGSKLMIDWILERVKALPEVDGIYVVSNHKFSGHFEKWASASKQPWPLHIIDDQTTTNENRLGAIGDLAFTLKQKHIGAEDLLVLAGDNLFTFDLKAFVTAMKGKRPHGGIAVYDVKSRELAKRYGLVKSGADGKVLEFYEKPENPTTTLASCGIYWLPAETRLFIDKYLASGHNPDQPGHYMKWLSETAGLFAVPLEGEWFDIGDRASYDQANVNFKA